MRDRQGYEIDPYSYSIRPKAYRPKVLVPLILFLLTIITTVTAGALYQGADILKDPMAIAEGIPFSASLLLILGTHEFGHFLASRRHGVHTTLPVFIPGPPLPPFIGTFGAVIKIKSPITTKRALIDIGAAGPLSGFVVALFVTVWGLKMSTVMAQSPPHDSIAYGTSIIFKLLIYLVFGYAPENIALHPVAVAGWFGFFVTAMNLLPMGQLDGGHIVYALLGKRHRAFSVLIAVILVSLGFITSWYGWILWAGLIYAIGMWHPPIEDQDVPMDWKRRLVTASAILVFILTFLPLPIYIV